MHSLFFLFCIAYLFFIPKEAEALAEINNLKKMQGYDSFYRIRLGEYRLGIEVFESEIIFVRFLHRKDIYKFFP